MFLDAEVPAQKIVVCCVIYALNKLAITAKDKLGVTTSKCLSNSTCLQLDHSDFNNAGNSESLGKLSTGTTEARVNNQPYSD